jgi:hypothetical protein
MPGASSGLQARPVSVFFIHAKLSSSNIYYFDFLLILIIHFIKKIKVIKNQIYT